MQDFAACITARLQKTEVVSV